MKWFLPEARDQRLTHALDVLNGNHLFLVITPGMGKTMVLLAPLIALQARGKSGILLYMVSAKVSGEQVVRVRVRLLLHVAFELTRL